MDMQLTQNETRVIGCLLEKEKTTPEQYPLSLNALTNACNQKSNRDPVMVLTQSEVSDTLNALRGERLISEDAGSRVSKYRHRFCNTEFSHLQLSEQESAIVCVLFLRGPQTPGELRSRTGRMTSFAGVSEAEAVLQGMISKGYVTCLPREAGKRESRYAHLFSGEVKVAELMPVDQREADKARIEALEHEAKVLRLEIERLNRELDSNSY